MWSHPSVHLGTVGPLRRSSGPYFWCENTFVLKELRWTGPLVRDKDAPLAAFEARVPVKLDIASWLRANPHPQAIYFRMTVMLLYEHSYRKSHSICSHLGRALQTLEPSTTAYEFRAATAICKCSNQIIYSRRAYIILQENFRMVRVCCHYRLNGHILFLISNEHLYARA